MDFKPPSLYNVFQGLEDVGLEELIANSSALEGCWRTRTVDYYDEGRCRLKNWAFETATSTPINSADCSPTEIKNRSPSFRNPWLAGYSTEGFGVADDADCGWKILIVPTWTVLLSLATDVKLFLKQDSIDLNKYKYYDTCQVLVKLKLPSNALKFDVVQLVTQNAFSAVIRVDLIYKTPQKNIWLFSKHL